MEKTLAVPKGLRVCPKQKDILVQDILVMYSKERDSTLKVGLLYTKGSDAMNITLLPPSDKQKLFLKDRHKHVAFGGA